MQIMIEIPKGAYEEIVNAKFPVQDAYRLVAWIKGGTPLPKGHGRLKDSDAICKDIISALGIRDENYLLEAEKAVYKRIKNAPTIIEADKEERPDNICTQRCCLKNHNIGIIECDEECSNRTSF